MKSVLVTSPSEYGFGSLGLRWQLEEAFCLATGGRLSLVL